MEAATASRGNRGGEDDPNKHNKGKTPDKSHYNLTPRKPKQTRGRRPIKIERIEDEEARFSTFSKRRSGIYKNVNDIVTLTGVHLGLAMITPAERAFSYSEPFIEDIINRFLNQHYAQLEQQKIQMSEQQPVQSLSQQGMEMMVRQGGGPCKMDMVETIMEAHRKRRVNSLNWKHKWLTRIIQAEKEKSTALVEISRPFENPDGSAKYNIGDWWELLSNENLTDEDINHLAKEIQKFIVRIGESRLMRELQNTITSPPCADEANPSYPPPQLMQGYESSLSHPPPVAIQRYGAGSSYPPPPSMQGYEAGPYYPPLTSMRRFMNDNISDDVPRDGGEEIIPNYNPHPLMSHMQGMTGNNDVHKSPAIHGGMHFNEEDTEDLAARYFNNDEGPHAGDF